MTCAAACATSSSSTATPDKERCEHGTQKQRRRRLPLRVQLRLRTKSSDTVSYRNPQIMGMPFVAVIKAVYDDYIKIVDESEPDKAPRATR